MGILQNDYFTLAITTVVNVHISQGSMPCLSVVKLYTCKWPAVACFGREWAHDVLPFIVHLQIVSPF